MREDLDLFRLGDVALVIRLGGNAMLHLLNSNFDSVYFTVSH
jgi:hypothetical protein